MAVEKVAVIGGTGEEGFGLALRWARAGIEIVIGSRDEARGKDAANRLRELLPDATVSGMDNAAAAASSELLMVTVPFAGQATIYKSIAESVRPDSVVIDGTVPVAAAVGAKAVHTLGVWEGSAAQQAAAFLPKGTRTCAAFHSLAAVALNDLDYEMEGDVLVCGSPSTKPPVRELVEAIPGLRFVDAGPLENARIVEQLTALLIGINHRYDTDRSGIRVTGLPDGA